MVGGIPGVIHSWYVVLKYPEDGIPFLDNLIHSNRRQDGEYQTLSDDEESSYTPPQSAAPQSPRLQQQQHQSYNSQPHYEDQPSGSSNAQLQGPPPSYGTDQYSSPARGDNKIQYHDEQFGR